MVQRWRDGTGRRSDRLTVACPLDSELLLASLLLFFLQLLLLLWQWERGVCDRLIKQRTRSWPWTQTTAAAALIKPK